MANASALLLPLGPVDPATRWFSRSGCVVRRADGGRDVFVSGSLVGRFAESDVVARDVVLCTLGVDPAMHLGRLGEAFELSPDFVRVKRRLYEREGVAGLVNRRLAGRPGKVTEAIRLRLHRWFGDDLTVTEVHTRATKARLKLSRSTIGREMQAWNQARLPAVVAAIEPAPAQLALVAVVHEGENVATITPEATAKSEVEAPIASDVSVGSLREGTPEIAASDVCGGAHVQHLGAWLLVAIVAQLGLHDSAISAAGKRVDARALRIAIDATLVALAIGEPTVEGVRRLATSTAPVLLRASHAPSPTWIRQTLHQFSSDGGAPTFHWRMLQRYLASARREDERPAVFYVDNHLRRYTGQEVLRFGWRMQDKRAVPGITDYYIHDEMGCPLWREPVEDHASLTAKLKTLAAHVRIAFGDDAPRVLLAFDRAGAFPGPMSELRDAGVDFVTYERKPYPLLAKTAFDQRAKIFGEVVRYHEARTNLRKQRGRVRRIAMLTDDGRQVNFLASSALPAAELMAVQQLRWRQENAFKHGAERWGINQLDSRKTDSYPVDTIVPNPARRRLDRSIHAHTAREGQLRCALASATDAERRAELQAEIADVIARRGELLELRPSMPTHAPLAETELADDLVKHRPEYKTTIDTLRIACANAEAELAAMLAPLLSKPAEAKKLLAAVFRAPGSVRVGSRTIGVKLDIAATDAEREAIATVCRELDGLELTLPGDELGRRLRVRPLGA